VGVDVRVLLYGAPVVAAVMNRRVVFHGQAQTGFPGPAVWMGAIGRRRCCSSTFGQHLTSRTAMPRRQPCSAQMLRGGVIETRPDFGQISTHYSGS
jgi:hypothetical protein